MQFKMYVTILYINTSFIIFDYIEWHMIIFDKIIFLLCSLLWQVSYIMHSLGFSDILNWMHKSCPPLMDCFDLLDTLLMWAVVVLCKLWWLLFDWLQESYNCCFVVGLKEAGVSFFINNKSVKHLYCSLIKRIKMLY